MRRLNILELKTLQRNHLDRFKVIASWSVKCKEKSYVGFRAPEYFSGRRKIEEERLMKRATLVMGLLVVGAMLVVSSARGSQVTGAIFTTTSG